MNQRKIALEVYNRSHDSRPDNDYMSFMKYLTPSRWPWFTLLLSSGLMIGAWFFQYGLGYEPCQMCYWQRHAHKAVIVLSVLALILNHLGWGRPKQWLSLIVLGLLVSFGMGFWHMGVEYKWWEGPQSCMSTGDISVFDPDDLLGSLSEPVKLPACSDAVWHFLGLSMAGWNALISLLGAAVSAAALKGRDHG